MAEESPGEQVGAALLAGARRTLPLALGVGLYSTVFGALAATKGLSLAELVLMSVAVFSGTAQIVALDLWRTDPPVFEIALAVLLVNARYVLICATVGAILAPWPLFRRLAAAHLIADENWAVTMAARARGPTGPAFLVGGGIACFVFFVGGGALGHLLGVHLPAPERFGLEFAFTAAFIALALGLWRGSGDLAPWLAAGAAALAGAWLLPGSWYIFTGCLAGMAVAAYE